MGTAKPRRSFLKKTLSTIGAAVLAGYTGLANVNCKGGNGPVDPPPVPTQYTVIASNRNVFNEQDIGGKVIITTDQGTFSGSNNPTITVSTTNDIIQSIKTDVPGYNNSYIMTKDQTARVIYTMDANGPHQLSLNPSSKTITLVNYLIPASFDTVTFARCIGNSVGGADLGDGTVQNWNKDVVDVGTHAYPDQPTAQTLEYDRQAADIINAAAKGTLVLNYKGKVSAILDNGCTHLVDNKSYFHGVVNVTDNVYQKSGYYTPNIEIGVNLSTIIEEMMNSNTGIRFDAGGANPYIKSTITEEGKLAIQLVNIYPLRFKFSTTTSTIAGNVAYFETPNDMMDSQPGMMNPNIMPERPGMRYREPGSREAPERNNHNH